MTDFNLWIKSFGEWRIKEREWHASQRHDLPALSDFLRRYSIPFFIEWHATEPE